MAAKNMILPQQWIYEEKLSQEEIDTINGWLAEEVDGEALLHMTGEEMADKLFDFLMEHSLPPWHPVVEYFRWYAIANRTNHLGKGLGYCKIGDFTRPACMSLEGVPYVLAYYRILDEKGEVVRGYKPLCMIVPDQMVTWNMINYMPVKLVISVKSLHKNGSATNMKPETILYRAVGKGVLTEPKSVYLDFIDSGHSFTLVPEQDLRGIRRGKMPEAPIKMPKRSYMQGLQWWLRRFHDCLPDFDRMTETESNKVAHIMDSCCRRLKTVKDAQENRDHDS